MKIPNSCAGGVNLWVSLARIVSEDSQLLCLVPRIFYKSSKDS